MSRRCYPSLAAEAEVLRHARTAPHPFLGCMHFYGPVPWANRLRYYLLIKKKLKAHGMKWPAEWRKYETERGECRLSRAAQTAWTIQIKYNVELLPCERPRELLLAAQRQANLPPFWGWCSLMEGRR
jgi:hypothetical protein